MVRHGLLRSAVLLSTTAAFGEDKLSASDNSCCCRMYLATALEQGGHCSFCRKALRWRASNTSLCCTRQLHGQMQLRCNNRCMHQQASWPPTRYVVQCCVGPTGSYWFPSLASAHLLLRCIFPSSSTPSKCVNPIFLISDKIAHQQTM